MATPALTPQQKLEALQAYDEYGSERKAALALGLPRSTFQSRLQEAKADRTLQKQPELPLVGGRIKAIDTEAMPLPRKGAIFRYIFTCAQSNTKLHDDTWVSLVTLAEHYNARICVSTYTYDLGSYGPQSVKRGKVKTAPDEPWYDPRITPHILDSRVEVAPGLVWCGEQNILPTAVNPLSGLESYTGRKSAIIPHAKFAMQSIASGKHEPTKFNYTTGTITQRNYIAKKTGLKAEFHHGYGAVLVEVNSDGQWWVRQLNATSDGEICDLDIVVHRNDLRTGQSVEAINWGDIHWGTVSPDTIKLFWGEGGVLDTLQPRYQFMHDTLNWYARNHHEMKNPHAMFRRFVEGRDDVMAELWGCVEFLSAISFREWCKTVVVDSNHDEAYGRWLREADYRHDPKNAITFLEAQLAFYKAIRDRDKDFNPFAWFYNFANTGKPIHFLGEDEQFVICRDANGGIDCSMHGHFGPNGARGSLRSFAKMGRKSNTGHGHAAGIDEGAYAAGVTGSLDQGYNKGPSNWSNSLIATYRNGKRSIITVWGGKWRA